MLSGEHLLTVLWKRRRVFLAVFLVTLGAVAAVTFTLPKAYTTVSYVWVSASETPESDFEATQLSQVLARSYAELLQTRNVAQAVEARLSFDTSADDLLSAVEVSAPNQSQLLALEAEGRTPERAREIANTYAEVFVGRSAALEVRGATNSRVTLAEEAPLVTDPSRPRPLLYLLVGLIVAAITAVGAALLRNALDQRIRVDSSTTEVLGLPVLARVPRSAHSTATALIGDDAPSAGARSSDEAFRSLVANLWFVSVGRQLESVAVVSASEREGKSTSCANIARAAAGVGSTVLLVDGDLRKPSLTADLCPAPPRSGLSSLLLGVGDIGDASIEILGASVQLLPAGPIPPNPTALLSSDEFGRIDRAARDRFDFVVYDTPPVSIGADASLVAGRADGTILVIDTATTRRSAVVQAIAQLERAQARILGIVLNRVRDKSRSYYYEPAAQVRGRGFRKRRKPAAEDAAEAPLVRDVE